MNFVGFDQSEDRWAGRLFAVASQLINPHCSLWRYNYYRLQTSWKTFDSYPRRVQEVAFRALIVAADVALCYGIYSFPLVGALGVFGLPIAFVVARAAAAQLQYKGPELGGFTHTRGGLAEKDFSGQPVKLMTLNVSALAGGLSIGFAGTLPWEYRIQGIVDMIKDQNPDVLVLQEVMDTDFSRELIKRLHGNFAHFFSHLGVSRTFPAGGFAPGGVFVATTGAVSHFSDHPFTCNGADQCRSFACLELLDRAGGTPMARFLGTHPHWKDDERDRGRRRESFTQMHDWIRARARLPSFILSDTNMEPAEQQGTAPWMKPYYEGGEPTCDHALPSQWKRDGRFAATGGQRHIDNIFWVEDESGKPPGQATLIKAFDVSKPDEAITDHHGIFVELRAWV